MKIVPEKKKILVVEDTEQLRVALGDYLRQAGYDVVLAENGKLAQHLIGIEELDAVLSDIRMPEVNGIELLHFIKRTKPMPVILMTGFAELTETKEAFELGASDFIAKPFKKEDLISVLRKCLGEVDESGNTNFDDLYCKLSIDDFVSGRKILYDIYIRLSENKYVKVAHKGEDISTDRIAAYKSKNIRYLYMSKDDFRAYVGFNLTLADAIKSSSQIPRSKKTNLLKHTGEIILEQLHFGGVDEESFDYAKTFVETTVATVGESAEAFNILGILNNHSDHLYAHSVGVSLYSVMIAREMRWTSAVNTFKISMAGLLHDIGKKEIDRAILDKSRIELRPDEIALIETHATRSVEILSQLQSIPGDIIQIVGQHHENCMGQGYPGRLKKDRIHPLSRLLAVADEFCYAALKGVTHEGIPPHDAIRRMLTQHADKLDPVFFTALFKLFKFDPPAQYSDPHAWGMDQKSRSRRVA